MASLGECLPPIRPADLRRGSGCLQNRLLLLQRQAPVSEAVQRPLDDPRLQRHPAVWAGLLQSPSRARALDLPAQRSVSATTPGHPGLPR